MTGAKAQLTPPVTPQEVARVAEWAFGYFTGISRAGEGPADGVAAADGSQVAFLTGDLRVNDAPSKIRNIFGADLAGLLPGRTYELSWQQMARPTNRGIGQLAVDLNVPESKPLAIHGPGTRREQGSMGKNRPSVRGHFTRDEARLPALGCRAP